MVIPNTDPSAQFTGWGQESVSALLRPLQSGPKVELNVDRRLQLDDLDFSEETIAVIQEREEAMLNANNS